MIKKSIISCSGGMDSTSLLIKLLADGKKPYVLNFNYGQKHDVEIERLQQNITYLKEKGFDIEYHNVNLSSIMSLFHSSLTSDDIETPTDEHYTEENQKKTVVPNRNAIFSSLVYGYALSISLKENEKTEICLGVHAGDESVYPDCRQEFYDKIFEAFAEGNWGSENVSIYTPYISIMKRDILEEAQKNIKKLGLDFNTVFANTNTCYSPNDKGESCGHCASCIERLEGFEKLGVKDPVPYAEDYDDLIENMKKVNSEG